MLAGASSSSPVGTYVSSCTGAADPNYSFSYVNGRFRLNPAPLTIAASSASVTYGGAAASITPTYSGFVNGDSAASLGTAPIVLDHGHIVEPRRELPEQLLGCIDPNYTINYVPGEVVVGSATLVVTASSGSTTTAASVPSITPSYAGFVNGDSASSLTTQADVLDNGHVVEHGGELPNVVQSGRRPQLHIVYVGGAVNIGAAPLSVTACPPP